MNKETMCPICKAQFTGWDADKRLKRHISTKKDIHHKHLARLKHNFRLSPYWLLKRDYFDEFERLEELYGKAKRFDEENEKQVVDETYYDLL